MSEPRTDRLVVVLTSPRLPAGLLSVEGWAALRSGPVFAASGEDPQAAAVIAAGVPVHTVPGSLDDRLRELRAQARRHGRVGWLTGADSDLEAALLAGVLAEAGRDPAYDVETVFGSWDPPGAWLLDVVRVMDRLRSPGGCPWDATQTHESLAQYLVEEAYEAADAIADGDLAGLREELGDVLLQVAFHARIAGEYDESRRWTIDDVAADLVAKLIRRHPHVFAGQEVSGRDELDTRWEAIKAAEKGRTGPLDGVVWSQPALSLAAQLIRRARRFDLPAPDRTAASASGPGADGSPDELGAELLALVAAAVDRGVDPETALRAAARRYAARFPGHDLDRANAEPDGR